MTGLSRSEQPLDGDGWNAVVQNSRDGMKRTSGVDAWSKTVQTVGGDFDVSLLCVRPGEFCAQAIIADLSKIQLSRAVVDRAIRHLLKVLGRRASTTAVIIQDDALVLKCDALGVTKPSQVYACLNELVDRYPGFSKEFFSSLNE